jgi:hypothetical protein
MSSTSNFGAWLTAGTLLVSIISAPAALHQPPPGAPDHAALAAGVLLPVVQGLQAQPVQAALPSAPAPTQATSAHRDAGRA